VNESAELYRSILNLFQEGLPPSFFTEITNDGVCERKTMHIELIPGKCVRKYSSGRRDLLDTQLQPEPPSW